MSGERVQTGWIDRGKERECKAQKRGATRVRMNRGKKETRVNGNKRGDQGRGGVQATLHDAGSTGGQEAWTRRVCVTIKEKASPCREKRKRKIRQTNHSNIW